MREPQLLRFRHLSAIMLLSFLVAVMIHWLVRDGLPSTHGDDWDRSQLDASTRRMSAHRTVELTNSIGMKLVRLPGGEFMMGCPHSTEELARKFGSGNWENWHLGVSLPPRKVTIPNAFFMGRNEVTVEQFGQFVEATGYETEAERKGSGGGVIAETGERTGGKDYSWKNTGWKQSDSHPVVNVTWNDAMAFCEWLSQKEGKRYRLPMQAEWEYACRARSQTLFSSGDVPESLSQAANIGDGFEGAVHVMERDGHRYAASVGSYPANRFGLHDMHGNVSEWCADHLFLRTDWKAVRGGSWTGHPFECRSSRWEEQTGDWQSCTVGFRVIEGAPALPAIPTLSKASKPQNKLIAEIRKRGGPVSWELAGAIRDGADVNGFGNDGFTALYWAAVYLKDAHLVHCLIDEHDADPNLAMAGGLTPIDVLGLWLWEGLDGGRKLTLQMRKCPASIPFGLLEEDFLRDMDEEERADKKRTIEQIRIDVEWTVWTLYQAGAKPTIGFNDVGDFETLCKELEPRLHESLLEKISEDVFDQKERQVKADDLRDWIARHYGTQKPGILQSNRDARAYVGGSTGRPGQLARIIPPQRSNALGVVFEIDEKRERIEELEKPIRNAERWVKLRYACSDDEAKRLYDGLRNKIEESRR